MWSDKGWKHITAEEAAKLHPQGTVSAQSGLFMCELCGQYVLLTDSNVQVRHFRHSSSEKSKDCPERTFGARVTYSFKAGEHELPIRIKNITSSRFELEIGFIQVPHLFLTDELKIEIRLSSPNRSFIYAGERINRDSISYLSVGNIPSENYTIELVGTKEEVRQFWPNIVHGIDSEGALFDSHSGKKLVNDADVVVGKHYYLLKRSPLLRVNATHIGIREISRQRIEWKTWYLYDVVVNDYDEESARFFLDYHCRLTEQPVSIQPVWPVYVENPYIIKHSQDDVMIHVQGNAPTTRVFPNTTIKKYTCADGIVAEINANQRQQMISAGRTKALQYAYFWKDALTHTTVTQKAIVKDIHDVMYDNGVINVLPEKRLLKVLVPYDGTITIKRNNALIERRRLQANMTSEIENIVWGTELCIAIGLDRVWRAKFIPEAKHVKDSEEIEVLRKLKSYKGSMIKIHHTIGSLATFLSGYPQIQQWLFECIRLGYMNEQAYRYLQFWIRSGKR